MAATLSVFVRDTVQALGVALTVLFYATPIVYPASLVPARLRPILSANPVAHLVEWYRGAFTLHTAPEPLSILFVTACAVGSAVLGAALFARARPHFAGSSSSSLGTRRSTCALKCLVFSHGGSMKRTLLLSRHCRSRSGPPPALRPGSLRPRRPRPRPTPSIGRVNPFVIEETATYIIERYPKEGYIRVDDRHFKSPIIGAPAEFFKEDDQYYYVKTDKVIPEEEALKRQARERAGLAPPDPGAPRPSRAHAAAIRIRETSSPPRGPASFRLEEVKDSGLPAEGLWRASFSIADMNGDGIPDIVAPPPRMAGESKLHVWLGDGKGHFAPWKLTFLEGGRENPDFAIDYGGVAIGDVDGDGQLDVVAASHNRGLVALFGNGKGTFVVARRGFRGTDFSTQAVALADVNGDGKLDVIAAADKYDAGTTSWNRDQVHVYLSVGNRAFQRKADGIFDGSFSLTAESWDFDQDGRADVLLGSRYFSAVLLLFRNQGDGTFAPVVVPDTEVWSYHFALAPGTVGKDRAPAFADLFYKGSVGAGNLRAAGINIHVNRKGQWEKRVLWREKMSGAVLNTIAFGDLDGDGLDDVVFPDTLRERLRIFLQQPDGTFQEADEKDEPPIGPVAQCVRLADLNGDGRLDVVLSKTVVGSNPPDQGGWSVFLNRRK